MANIRNLDLNLLVVAASLFSTRNVSRSARELGLSQSAVSHALKRLRDFFGDPLFVRASRGIVATDFAESIRVELLDVVGRADQLVRRKSAFDPREARGRITIASTDYVEIVILAELIAEAQLEAPNVQISLRPTLGDLPRRDLEEGRADFAVAGFYARLPEGFYQARLGRDGFACAVRKDHPTIRGRLTEDAYFAAKHALVTLQGDFADDVPTTDVQVMKRKRKAPRERAIVYGSYSFTGPAWVLTRSDMVFTAPRRLLEAYARHFPIRVLPSPVELGSLELKMVWHARTHHDPLRAWFRELLRRKCKQIFE